MHISKKPYEEVDDNSSIPLNWKVEKLGDLLEFKNGLNYRVGDIGEEIFLVGVSEFKDNFLIDEGRLSTINVQSIPDDYLMKNGDFVFVRSNGSKELIGRVLFAKNITKKVTHSGFTIRARSKSNVVLNEYCALFCSSHLVKKQFMTKGGGSNINNLNQQLLSDIDIILPPINEQGKIVEILNTWGEAIALKEKYIEQKRVQKKALMQKLLTGKVRLPGCEEEWKEVRLGDLFKERRDVGNSNLELLAITSQKGIVRRTEIDIKDNSSDDKSKYKKIVPFDIGYNTMRMWQGVSGVSKYEGIVSPAYTILKPNSQVDSNFFGILFKSPEIINLFRRYSQGLVDDTLSLKYGNFKGIKVRIPEDVSEQKAIAEILLRLDNHIELIEKDLGYLKQQKRGLMQLLLTGKVRVKV
ncbi:restriction endonuclease subunit S [Paenibacillus sp. FSL H8-0283]|uniref:restriction endonuclease subunit S n=1 Tax=Paenibacillus sp. FSL H8-0283 TaxID=2921383 RepID=UPI00324DD151